MINRFSAVFLAAALTLTMFGAAGQYPNKPIRIIVPFAAGGASDSAARTLGQSLSKSMGQPVVIENRPGASGSLAAQVALTSPGDGYTLLWASASMVAIPIVQKASPYQSLNELVAISKVGVLDYCLYVPSTLPVKNIGEFVAYARANPGKLSYATGSLSEYVVTEQFNKAVGISLVQVPYKGGAQAMPDLISGRVQFNIGPIAGGIAHVKGGKLRMLATLQPVRGGNLPGVPSLSESGVKDIFAPSWQALFAPPGTPKTVVERVSREVAIALRDPGLLAQFALLSIRPEASSASELANLASEDLEKWRRFAREYSIQQE